MLQNPGSFYSKTFITAGLELNALIQVPIRCISERTKEVQVYLTTQAVDQMQSVKEGR